MEIKDVKEKISEIEDGLDDALVVEFARLNVNDRELVCYLTSILKKTCKKKKVWKSKNFLITLKNIKYGIDADNLRSKSGKDGIFLLDRNFTPKNKMQVKIFDQFIDKKTSSFKEIVAELGLNEENIEAVRVVSHHMRLLGICERGTDKDVLVLVNFDDEK